MKPLISRLDPHGMATTEFLKALVAEKPPLFRNAIVFLRHWASKRVDVKKGKPINSYTLTLMFIFAMMTEESRKEKAWFTCQPIKAWRKVWKLNFIIYSLNFSWLT